MDVFAVIAGLSIGIGIADILSKVEDYYCAPYYDIMYGGSLWDRIWFNVLYLVLCIVAFIVYCWMIETGMVEAMVI